MSSLMANALDTWTAFLTAEEAAARITEAAPSLTLAEVASTIQDLVGGGCLVARSRIVDGDACPDSSPPGNGVSWLAIPTADRAQPLERSVRSYLENATKFGRKCRILVADDSRDASHRAASLEMLSAVDAVRAVSVWYCGPDDKLAFAKHLARKGHIPPESIHFGLFGSGGSTFTTGANRNSILLHTFGSMLLSVDDETVRDARLVPGTEAGLAMADHFDPAEVWCFSQRRAALSFGLPAQVDVFGGHSNYLGRPVSEILRRENGWGDASVCIHLISSLVSGDARIRVTYNGARGDSGLHSDLGPVACRLPATRRRVQSLSDRYRATLDSRQIMRQATCLTLSHVDSPAIGMFMGMDNRLPLPPFIPDCRNEDGVFASVLARMSDHCYAAHLPFTLTHEPPGPCFYPPDRDAHLRISDLIAYCLTTWRPEPGERDPLGRMSAMGRHLCRLGALPAGDFDEVANVLMCSRVCSTIELMAGLLAEDGCQPSWWAEDLTARIEALRKLTDSRHFFIPVDLPADSDHPPQRRAQRIVARYGQLLEWWPAIAERAVELRNHGITIGRCLSVARAAERTLAQTC